MESNVAYKEPTPKKVITNKDLNHMVWRSLFYKHLLTMKECKVVDGFMD